LSIYTEISKTIQSLVKQFRALIIIPSFVKLFRAVNYSNIFNAFWNYSAHCNSER